MLLDIVQKLVKLFNDIADEGNAPDAPDADETGMIGVVGEREEPLTSYGYVRNLLPALRVLTPAQHGIAMTPAEVAAWDMLCQHGFSRASLRRSGELEDYLALGVSPELEARWRAACANALLEGFEARPEGMDTAMLIAAEYGDRPLLERALEVLDDAVSEERVPGSVVLRACRNAMLAAEEGHFDGDFAAQVRAQCLELADRAEYHLSQYDPDGDWREIHAAIRERGARGRTRAGDEAQPGNDG